MSSQWRKPVSDLRFHVSANVCMAVEGDMQHQTSATTTSKKRLLTDTAAFPVIKKAKTDASRVTSASHKVEAAPAPTSKKSSATPMPIAELGDDQDDVEAEDPTTDDDLLKAIISLGQR